MSEEEAGEPDPVEEPADDLVTTRHTLRTSESAGRGPGDELAYTATAGRIVLRREQHTEGAFDGHKPTAEVFVVAYTADRPDGGSAGWDPADRPLTVAFNGGPGSSSVWLHLGLLGPRRVLSGDAGSPVAPPYRLTDNGESLLAHSDLLFIDPTEFEGRAVSVGDTLAAAMRANPHLRVHVGCGDYDGATPYQGAEHMIAGLTIPDELRANIEFRYYESGHMPYVHEPTRRLLQSADLARFVLGG